MQIEKQAVTTTVYQLSLTLEQLRALRMIACWDVAVATAVRRENATCTCPLPSDGDDRDIEQFLRQVWRDTNPFTKDIEGPDEAE